MSPRPMASRRQFLGGSLAAMGCTAAGAAIAQRTGLAAWLGVLPEERLRFGALDALVDLLQATDAEALMPRLAEKLKAGLSLSDLAGATDYGVARWPEQKSFFDLLMEDLSSAQAPTIKVELPSMPGTEEALEQLMLLDAMAGQQGVLAYQPELRVE